MRRAALLSPLLLASLVRLGTGLLPSPSPPPSIAEGVWRPQAAAHRQRVLDLLHEGFVPEQMVPRRYERTAKDDGFRKLNERHAVYNFLHEYYNVRGARGTRRIGRWSSGLPRVTLEGATAADVEAGTISPVGCTVHAGGATYDAPGHFREAPPSSATPFLWYRDLLSATQAAEPILHCYNLHEWAMQYWPEGSPPPPSRRYQDGTARLRVDRETINTLVEEQGVRCTHVDALRFFAPAAGPLNSHGASLEREQQIELEQPGCVHAHMDLLKVSLRLSPWIPAELVADSLELALAARRLDVSASPYEWPGLEPVRVETDVGRKEFRERQVELMHRAQPVRASLLAAYDRFLGGAFGEDRLGKATPDPERYATAQPGGPPWRRSLIEPPVGGGGGGEGGA